MSWVQPVVRAVCVLFALSAPMLVIMTAGVSHARPKCRSRDRRKQNSAKSIRHRLTRSGASVSLIDCVVTFSQILKKLLEFHMASPTKFVHPLEIRFVRRHRPELHISPRVESVTSSNNIGLSRRKTTDVNRLADSPLRRFCRSLLQTPDVYNLADDDLPMCCWK